jgi:MarR family transcriptional regulator, organic hydroperoxide resistance regulator
MASKKKSTPTPPLGFLLWQTANAWQRYIKTVLDPVGITHVQFLLLESIDNLTQSNQSTTQIRVAKDAGTDVMMTSKVLRALEEKKMIARKTSKTDARAIQLLLTTTGQKCLERASALVGDADEKFFRNLESKPEKFEHNLKSLIGQ